MNIRLQVHIIVVGNRPITFFWFDLILFYSEEIKTQGIHVYADITDNYKLKITIKIRSQTMMTDSLTRIYILKIMKQLLIYYE